MQSQQYKNWLQKSIKYFYNTEQICIEKMKSIGTGLRRLSDQSDQREECQIEGIGKYRTNSDIIEYQVLWKGYPPTYQKLQNLQECAQHIKEIFIERKTKTIRKRRPCFPTHLKRYALQNQYNKCKNNLENPIKLQSDSQQSEYEAQIQSKSLPSEEGELKIEDCRYNPKYINQSDYQEEGLLKPFDSQKSIQFEQNQIPAENSQSSVSGLTCKKIWNDQNPTINLSKASQNNSEVEEILQKQSVKNQNPKQESIQEEKNHKSIHLGIYKQKTSQISINPQVDLIKMLPLPQKIKQKPKLKLKKGNIDIKIEPIKKEEVLVTKSIRNNKKVMFEIMVYNQQGILIPKMISVQELRKKAPNALLKYYESRIIY